MINSYSQYIPVAPKALLSKKEELALCVRITESEKGIIRLLINTYFGLKILSLFLEKIKTNKKRVKKAIKQDPDEFNYKEVIGEIFAYFEFLKYWIIKDEIDSVQKVEESVLGLFQTLDLNEFSIQSLIKQVKKLYDQAYTIEKHNVVQYKEKLYGSLHTNFDTLQVVYYSMIEYEDNIKKAKEQLVIHNIRLVIDIAKKYSNRGIELSDLIQEGTMGLMRALTKFDHRKGFRFSTYATWWVRQMITSSISNHSRLIRLPSHAIEEINRLEKAHTELTKQNGTSPGTMEVSSYVKKNIEQVHQVQLQCFEPLSLNNGVYNDEAGSSELKDYLYDEKTSELEEQTVNNNIYDKMKQGFKFLTPREEKVIRLMFAITDLPKSLLPIEQQIQELANKS